MRPVGSVTRRSGLGLIAAGLAAPQVLAQPAPRPTRGAVADKARALDQLHAIVWIERGEVRLADAFRGPGLDRPANVKSVSKTLVATLAGIAIDRGVIPDAAAPILPIIGRGGEGPRAKITLGHCLSMQTGLASTSGAAYGNWVSSRDWIGHALARPMVSRPGGRFIYSTGAYHLAGAALAEASGSSLLALARDWIGRDTGITFPAWIADPQGYYLGGNEMALTPRDLARFGEVILAGGRWQDRQIVSRAWIADSWRPRARSPWSGDRYGYGWFLTRMAGTWAAYGRGYGGQMLLVAPERELVLAVTSDPTRPARSDGYFGALRGLAVEVVEAAGAA